jgi:hypothetical protein
MAFNVSKIGGACPVVQFGGVFALYGEYPRSAGRTIIHEQPPPTIIRHDTSDTTTNNLREAKTNPPRRKNTMTPGAHAPHPTGSASRARPEMHPHRIAPVGGT